MPKICFVAPHYYTTLIGGAEVQNYILSKKFRQQGWEVHHVIGDLNCQIIHQDMVLHPCDITPGFKKAYANFSKLLNEIDADIFYQRGRNIMTALLSRYSKQTAKPFIFATSMDIDCLKYKQIARVLDSNAHPIKRAIQILIKLRLDRLTLQGMRTADLVLSQSSYQQSQLDRNLNITSHIFKNVHHVPAEKGLIKANPPIVLWLSSLKKWKRPEIFINIVKKLGRHPYQFILAGRMANEKYRKTILKLKSEQRNFNYIENISFEESNKLISKSSVLINTSRIYEGFPNTFIQAWLRKTPTISLDFDPDNILKNESVGIHSGSYENLLSNINFLLNHKKDLWIMGSKARKFAIREFSVEKKFPFLLKILSPILESNR